MNVIVLIWDSWDHIGLKQPQNCKLNFKEKMVLISNSNFYYINRYYFPIYCHEMKFPHVLKINLPRFFQCTWHTCHNRWSKYKYLPWNTLYYIRFYFVHPGMFRTTCWLPIWRVISNLLATTTDSLLKTFAWKHTYKLG